MTVIGTWNLENLLRPGDPAGPTDQGAYQAKLASLAATVTAMAPDVLAVQEVGDPDALADLAAAVGGSWHLHTARDPGGRDVPALYERRGSGVGLSHPDARGSGG
jgi:hypothetical protein